MNTKIKKSTNSLYILLFIVFVSFISVEKFPFLTGRNQFRIIINLLELSIQVFILITSFIIYKNSNSNTKSVMKWIIGANLGLFVNEVSWLFFITTHKSLIQNIFSFFNFSSFYIWIIALTIALAKILRTQQRVSLKKSFFILISFISINLIIIFLFISSNFSHDSNFNLSKTIQFVNLFLQLIVYDLVILSLIYAESRGFIVLLFGIIALISGNFFSNYALSSELINISTYGILLWPIGLIFNGIGIFILNKDKDYNTDTWIRRDTAIKSSLAFWYFILSLAGFLTFLAISSALNLINSDIFEAIPLFLIIYSVIVIITSMWLGKTFEDPFRKIEQNINDFINKIEPTPSTKDFQLEEFLFLQNFLLKAFYSLKEADEAKLNEIKALEESKLLKLENESVQKILLEQEKFRNIVKQTLHDIQSPISSIATIIEKYSTNLPENSRLTLKSAANRINDIANNLLTNYAKPNDNLIEQTNVLVSSAVLQLISEKRYEYTNSNINFEINIDDAARFVFIKINQSSLKRALSNLINNAVDAIKEKSQKIIKIDLNAANNKVIIAIEDNGYGIPPHIKDKFFKQEAVTEGKDRGFGIGLVQVSETIMQFNGKCDIYSSPNSGTRFVIKFPAVSTPNYIATTINLNENDVVLIVDDDSSVHGAWAAKFHNYNNITIKHFSEAQKVLDFIKSTNKEELHKFLLLSDYELANQNINGLELIQQTNIKRSILVTSYADDEQIKEQIVKNHLLLLPKELIASIPIILRKNIIPQSKIVDMVWVEDQEWFSRDLINNFYSNLIVDTYANPDIFLEEFKQYKLDTKFILDTYYYTPDNKPFLLDGFQLAEILHKNGYNNLILFSGELITDRKIPDYLQVILKNDSENKSKLNLL